jgi:hypothetical protein
VDGTTTASGGTRGPDADHDGLSIVATAPRTTELNGWMGMRIARALAIAART